jgi:hypothetical protein
VPTGYGKFLSHMTNVLTQFKPAPTGAGMTSTGAGMTSAADSTALSQIKSRLNSGIVVTKTPPKNTKASGNVRILVH